MATAASLPLLPGGLFVWCSLWQWRRSVWWWWWCHSAFWESSAGHTHKGWGDGRRGLPTPPLLCVHTAQDKERERGERGEINFDRVGEQRERDPLSSPPSSL